MGRFKEKKSSGIPKISTASLPDIMFILLCFFMVSTTMRETTLIVKVKLPNASEVQKLERENLVCLFVLIDVRLKPQHSDIQFMELLGTRQIPFARIFTKSDKISDTEVSKSIAVHDRLMLETWEALPVTFISSSRSSRGREDILAFIEESINIFSNKPLYRH